MSVILVLVRCDFNGILEIFLEQDGWNRRADRSVQREKK